MSGKSITDILRSYGVGAVAQATTNTGPLVTEDELYDVAAGNADRSGVNIQNEVQRDLLTLDTFQMMEKYGPEAASKLGRDTAVQQRLYNADAAATRTTGDVIWDTGNAVFRGGVSSIAGIGALGLGLINDDAGAWAAEGIDQFNLDSKSMDSAGLASRRRAYEARGRMDAIDSEAQYRSEVAEKGDFVASLRMIGRDVVNAWENLDGAITGDVIAEGAGSLLSGGPLIKGASLGARGGLKLLQEGGIISRAARLRAGRIADKVIPAATIGTLEAGGTYQQTVNEVMKLDHSQLMETSADYRDLINSGMTIEDAKTSLANDTGLLAAGMSLPAAIAAGKLTSGFAAAPLVNRGFARAIGNTVRETAEEALQGAASELSSNIAMAENVDADTLIAGGVGDAITLGAIGGMGSAAGVQAVGAPAAAARAGKTATQKVMRVVSDQIEKGFSAVQEANSKASPISEDTISTAIQETEVKLAEFQAEQQPVQPQVDESEISPEMEPTDPVAQTEAVAEPTPEVALIDKLASVTRVNPEEELIEGMPESVQAAVTSSTNRLELIQNLGMILQDGTSTEDMFAAATVLLGSRDKIQATLEANEEALRDIPKDTKEGEIALALGGILTGMKRNTRINQIMGIVETELAKAAAAEAQQAPVTEQEISTPEGVARVSKTITIAEHSPTNASLEQITTILQHAESGRLSLTSDQQTILQTAASIIQTERNMLDERAKLGLTGNSDIVSGQILTDRDTGVEDKKLSAALHSRGIVAAVKAGELDVAKTRLGRFMDFAQHMQNKVEALNAHYAKGGSEGVKYLALVKGNWRESVSPLKVMPNSKKSIEFAQRVYTEAKAVTEIANQLSMAFPDLGVPALAQLDLDPALLRPAQEILNNQPIPEGVVGKRREAEAQPATTGQTETQTEAQTEPLPSLAPETETVPEMTVSDYVDRYIKGDFVGDKATPEIVQFAVNNASEIETEFTRRAQETEASEPVVEDAAEEIMVIPAADLTDEDISREREALVAQGMDGEIQPESVDRYRELVAEQEKRAAVQQEDVASEPVSEPTESVEADPAPVEADVVEEAPEAPETASEPVQETETETAVEDVIEEPVAAEEFVPPADTLTNRFSKLIGQTEGSKVTNFFLKYFRNKKESKSRLRSQAQPIAFVETVLQEGVYALADEKQRNRVNAPMIAAYGTILEGVREYAARVSQQLQTSLQKETKKDSGVSRLRALLTTGEQNRYYTGRLLNLIERNENGETVFNQELLESAALAAGQWFLTGMQQKPFRDKDWVEGVLDLNTAEKKRMLTKGEKQTLQAMFEKGMTQIEAINSLGAVIQNYWDVSAKSNAPKGIADGMAHAMAAELLEAMVAEDNLKVSEPVKDMLGTERLKEIGYKNLTLIERTGTVPEAEAFPDLIDRIVMQKPAQVFQFGEPSSEIEQTQLKNERADLTDEQKKALAARQQNAFRIDETAMDFTLGLTLDQAQELFGAGSINEALVNDQDLKARQGKNTSVSTAYAAVQSFYAQAQNYAKANNMAVGEVEAFFRYTWNRMNRLQMLGSVNPQNSKLMREVVLPTTVTADLSNRDGDHFRMFALAMAQHLGQKIENQRHDVSIRNVLEQLEGEKFAQSLSGLRTWLQTRSAGGAAPVPSDLIATLKQELGKDMSEVAVKSLIEFARYQEATPEQRKAFQTSMYIEADGKTNGPANAIALFSSGNFTTQWFDMMELGGAFFGAGPQHINQAITEKGGKDDMYLRGGVAMTEKSNQKRQTLGNAQLVEQFDMLGKFAQMFLGDVTVNEDGTVDFDRGFVKNPLTITLYGAGAEGIAGNIAEEILGSIYERMSAALAAKQQNPKLSDAEALFPNDENAETKYDEFRRNLRRLGSSQPVQADGQLVLSIDDKMQPLFDGQFKTFRADARAVANLEANILEFMVGPLREAITDTLGTDVSDNLRTVQVATNAASQVLAVAFQQERDRRLAERKARDPNFKNTDDLSRDEYIEIFEAVKHLAPVIENGSQIMMVNKDGKDDADVSFASSLSGKFADKGTVFVPQEAGVLGMPMIVIASADGMMQQLYAISPEGVLQTLDVFDGINVPITTAREQGAVINRSVFEAWQRNPMTGVVKMFEGFLSGLDSSLGNGSLKLDQKTLSRLALNFMDRESASKATLDEVRMAMKETLETLRYIDGEITDRQAVLAQVSMRVDQMAGLEAPHVNEGVGGSLKSHQALANLMNKRLEKQRAKRLKAEAKAAAMATEAEQFGVDHESGVKVITGSNISRLAASLNPSKWQQSLLKQSIDIASNAGYRVVAGSIEQVQGFLDSEGFDSSKLDNRDPRKNVKGLAIPEAKLIALLDPNSETLVHELIHAATLETLTGYYAGAKGVNSQLVGAVQRLEALANQFMKLDVSDQTTETIRAYESARNAMRQQMRAGNKAAALNEFMAWSLSNQKLANLLGQTKAAPLAQLVKKALKFIKRIVFGTQKTSRVGQDMLSNLRFNTEIVMQMPVSTAGEFAGTIAYQSESYGQDERNEQINRILYERLISHLEKTEFVDELRGTPEGDLLNKDAVLRKFNELNTKHQKVLNQVRSAFSMTDQEDTTVNLLMAVFASNAFLDPNSVSKAGEMLDHFLKNLTIEMFIEPGMENDVIAQNIAEAKFLALTSPAVGTRDAAGRTALLPVFMGLAMANSEFRQILQKVGLPETARDQSGTLDGRLDNMGIDLAEMLGRRITGQTGRETNLQVVMDALIDRVAKVTEDRQNAVTNADKRMTGFLDEANRKTVEFIERGSVWVQEKLATVVENTDNDRVRQAADAARTVAQLFDRTKDDGLKEGALKIYQRDGVPDILKNLIRDMVGRTDSNAPVYDMVKKVKTYVSQARQHYREVLPKRLAEKFSRPLDKSEWSALTTALAKTDIAALRRSFGTADINEMLQKTTVLDQQIAMIEAKLMANQPADGQKLVAKSKQLARYMLTRDPGSNLLRNAEAVSALLGEQVSKGYNAAANQVEQIDVLVTLYALKDLDQETRETVSNLVKTEADGVSFLVETLRGQKNTEDGKASGAARFNAYKGYYPEESRADVSVFVGNDEQFEQLVGTSYHRVDDYQNSNIDPEFLESRGVYVSKVKPRAGYSQGVMQTAQQTAGGVDLTTGLTHGRTVAGAIEDAHRVRKIYQNRFRETSGNRLIPVWDANGQIAAYERSVDPAILAPLEQETRLDKVIGIWRGRQEEELNSLTVNKELVNRMFSIWDKDRKSGVQWKSNYVNLLDGKVQKGNPLIREIIQVMPAEMYKNVTGTFENGEFWVRKDMLDDAMGVREASVRDIWSRNSKWNPQHLKMAEKVAVSIFGNEAYRYAVKAEEIIQNAASEARTIIVVKSVVVPLANMTWNALQLVTRGVPISYIAGNALKKKDELNDYLKTQDELIGLEMEFRAAKGNKARSQRLYARMTAIKDRQKRLSIWPLIEAGEFSSITEGTLEGDEDLHRGKLLNFMERAIDKLPPAAQTAAKYAMVGRDTALFAALQKSVQYGDFIAKALLFDHYTKNKGIDPKQALPMITEEFVNYDLQPGRDRGYLEKMGLLWFYHFKLRSVKVGASMIRNNPLQVLLMQILPFPDIFGPVGSPVTDNAVSVILDNRYHWSVGPSMGLGAPSLLPVAEVLS